VDDSVRQAIYKYEAEYWRANGKIARLRYNRGWYWLIHPNGQEEDRAWRYGEVRTRTETLKNRPSFVLGRGVDDKEAREIYHKLLDGTYWEGRERGDTERAFIRDLEQVLNRMPSQLWLFATGNLHVMRKDEKGQRAITQEGGMDPEYIVDSLIADCDGGDW